MFTRRISRALLENSKRAQRRARSHLTAQFFLEIREDSHKKTVCQVSPTLAVGHIAM